MSTPAKNVGATLEDVDQSTDADDVADSGGPDWAGIVDAFEADPQETAIEDAEEAPQDFAPAAEPETTVEEPAAEVAPEAPPPPEPEPEPAPEPVAEAPPPVEEPETQAQPQPQMTEEQMQEMREQYLSTTAQQYQLTEDQVASFVADPNSFLPRFAAEIQANAYQQIVNSVVPMILQQLPQQFEQLSTQREQRSTAEGEFYERFPELKAHDAKVREIGTIYRQVHPQATLQDFIRDVGTQAWLTLQMDVGELAGRLAGKEAAAPPAPEPALAPPQVPTGYSPANPGGAVPPAPAALSNPFDALTNEIEEEFYGVQR